MVLVDILLATYNGEKYLVDLLDSIFAQTYQNFRIIVRDDQSSDSTMDIVAGYRQKYPERIFVHHGEGKGPVQNFSALMSLSEAPYVMFCDQDDVWLPEKIAVSLDYIQSLEERSGSETPCLVHSDLMVVDQDLVPIAESFWRFSGIDGRRDSLGNLLVQNVVTGCAAMFNQALVDVCGPIPEGALMHDWWVGLVASGMGGIAPIRRPLIEYRQHLENKLGAREFSWNLSQLLQSLRKFVQGVAREDYFVDNENQAKLFYESYKDVLPGNSREILENFIFLREQPYLRRRQSLFRYGYFYNKKLQNVGLLIRL